MSRDSECERKCEVELTGSVRLIVSGSVRLSFNGSTLPDPAHNHTRAQNPGSRSHLILCCKNTAQKCERDCERERERDP